MSSSSGVKDFGWYLGTSAVSRALPFLLLPFLTRYLDPEEYGTLALYFVLNQLCAPFVGLGLAVHVGRRFFQCSRAELARLNGNVLVVLAGSAGLGVLAVLAVAAVRGSVLGFTLPWLLLLPGLAAMDSLRQINLAVLRFERRPIAYGACEIGSALIGVTATVVLVACLALGWRGRVLGLAAGIFALAVFGLFDLLRRGYLARGLVTDQTGEILKISIPLVPHLLAGTVIMASDRLFIERFLGAAAVGVYSVGYQVGLVVMFFTEAFNNVWSVWLFEQLALADKADKRRVVRLTYLFDLVYLGLAGLLAVCSGLIVRVMATDAYQGAAAFVGWVALGYALRGMYTLVYPYLVHAKKTYFLGIATTAGALLNLGGNYLLVPRVGAVGSAQATAVSFAVLLAAVWWYANRVCPMPWLPRSAA